MSDLEIYWQIAGGAAGTVDIILTGCVLNRFINPFLQHKAYARLPGAAYSAVMLALYVFPWYNGLRIVNLFGIACFFAAMYAVDKRNVRQKGFLAVSCYLLKWITGGVDALFWNFLAGSLLMMPYLGDKPRASLLVFCMLEILSSAVKFGTQLLFCGMIGRAYTCKKEDMTGRELVLMLSPLMVILSGYFIFSYWEKAYERDFKMYIEDAHPEYMWFRFCYQMLSFAAMLTIIMIYQNIKGTRRREQENAVLAKQIEEMQRHIGEVEVLYQSLRGLKHDMRNHVAVLENLIEKGEREEAAAYLCGMQEEGKAGAAEIKSGNPVTDVILAEKRKEMEGKGIRFTCDFWYPQESRINAFDISIILYNALDNAAEAAQQCEAPYVKLRSLRRKNVYLIEVINNSATQIIVDEESGLPETTKTAGSGHGCGLANIRRVAGRHFGDMEITQSGAEVRLTVMLMLA